MRVMVVGAAGQTGRLILDGLVAAGHDVVGLVRTDDAARRVVAAGASPAVADLVEVAPSELRALLDGADAVVWAAGAGFAGDPEAVDGDACVAAQRAADEAGVSRWVQISSMFADRPDEGPPFLRPVLHAKARADGALAESGLGWTIIRPGGLTNDAPIGQVDIGTAGRPVGGTIARADVASAAVACVDDPGTARRSFDLVSGATPIPDALAFLAEHDPRD